MNFELVKDKGSGDSAVASRAKVVCLAPVKIKGDLIKIGC